MKTRPHKFRIASNRNRHRQYRVTVWEKYEELQAAYRESFAPEIPDHTVGAFCEVLHRGKVIAHLHFCWSGMSLDLAAHEATHAAIATGFREKWKLDEEKDEEFFCDEVEELVVALMKGFEEIFKK